jgi:hypothetical protein
VGDDGGPPQAVFGVVVADVLVQGQSGLSGLNEPLPLVQGRPFLLEELGELLRRVAVAVVISCPPGGLLDAEFRTVG